jgi:hypothetical protein
MQRVRLDLDSRTFEALAQAAAQELRSIPWQAEWILRRHLGTDQSDPSSVVHEPRVAPTSKKLERAGAKFHVG